MGKFDVADVNMFLKKLTNISGELHTYEQLLHSQ